MPDAVLLKPGQLTDGEYEVIKRHTVLGAETLTAALDEFPEAEFLVMARDIALCHHERWDGGGYPAGLEGDRIPLEHAVGTGESDRAQVARILRLADHDRVQLEVLVVQEERDVGRRRSEVGAAVAHENQRGDALGADLVHDLADGARDVGPARGALVVGRRRVDPGDRAAGFGARQRGVRARAVAEGEDLELVLLREQAGQAAAIQRAIEQFEARQAARVVHLRDVGDRRPLDGVGVAVLRREAQRVVEQQDGRLVDLLHAVDGENRLEEHDDRREQHGDAQRGETELHAHRRAALAPVDPDDAGEER
ncbi:MAG: HD domain-containing phosphohydrolase [Planctomycetota bacterium]